MVKKAFGCKAFTLPDRGLDTFQRKLEACLVDDIADKCLELTNVCLPEEQIGRLLERAIGMTKALFQMTIMTSFARQWGHPGMTKAALAFIATGIVHAVESPWSILSDVDACNLILAVASLSCPKQKQLYWFPNYLIVEKNIKRL